MERGEADDGASDAGRFHQPPPPDDRLWRHPSEVPRLAASRPNPIRSVWPIALVSGLLGSVFTIGMLVVTGALGPAGSGVAEEAIPSSASAAFGSVPGAPTEIDHDDDDDAIVRIAEQTSPAIARIEVSGDTEGGGTGSGVIFTDDGLLLTNAHVVDGASAITVVLADGSEHEGRLLGSDALTDIAVIKIGGTERFPAAMLGSAADLQVGQATVAIGSPLGLIGGSSVTTGVVSALGRRVAVREGPPLLDMIQTDAAIAPGSSGGALLDRRGAVIGITTAIALAEPGYQGLGFATPIDIARSVADDIVTSGRAVHVWLGIEGHDLDAASAREAALPGGAVVAGTVDGGPAAQSGLRPDDIVVEVAGTEVTSMSALVIALRAREPGDAVDLVVVRDGERLVLPVELGVRPSDR